MVFNKIFPILLILFSCITPIASIEPNEKLVFSNYPESIRFPQEVFSNPTTDSIIRFHFYHINQTTEDLNQELMITNHSKEEAITLNIQSVIDKGLDGSKLSHKNSKIFWDTLLNNSKETIVIPPNSNHIIQPNIVLTTNEIGHGILRLENPKQHSISVSLQYKDSIYNTLPINITQPIIFESPIIKTVDITPYGPKTIISIGKKDTSKYSYNHGNYGQIYQIKLRFINPYNYSLNSEIFFNRAGGMARNAMVIDEKVFATKLVNFTNTPEKITSLTIPSHSVPFHEILLFPESGNYYPVEIIVSSLKRNLNDT